MAHVFNDGPEDHMVEYGHHTCFACGVQAECVPWGGRFFCAEQCYDAACGDEPAYSEDEADAMGCDALMWEELP